MRDLIMRIAPLSENYRKRKLSDGYRMERVENEWGSDVIGQHFDDDKFWRRLRDISEKYGMGNRFREFARSIIDWLDDLVGRIRKGLNREADAVARRQAEDIRNKIANVLVRYVNQMPADGYAENSTRATGKEQASTGAAESMDAPKEQIESVRRQYDGTDGWMKAPNGNPTNLTEEQWVQVRTPAFKEWFGDWEGDPDNAR